MCLLAYGAVMVYSATSAPALLEGSGSGTGYLVKFVVYGAIGVVLMRVLARDGVARIQGLVGPLLALSIALVLAVHIPHVGVAVNGARRWIGHGPVQFQPSELLKLALVLYAAHAARQAPSARARPARTVAGRCCWSSGARACWWSPSPISGRSLTIAFTTVALLVGRGHSAAQSRDHRRGGARRSSRCTRSPSRTRERA